MDKLRIVVVISLLIGCGDAQPKSKSGNGEVVIGYDSGLDPTMRLADATEEEREAACQNFNAYVVDKLGGEAGYAEYLCKRDSSNSAGNTAEESEQLCLMRLESCLAGTSPPMARLVCPYNEATCSDELTVADTDRCALALVETWLEKESLLECSETVAAGEPFNDPYPEFSVQECLSHFEGYRLACGEPGWF